MQLDLFCDNRRTIRLNDADGLLRALRLEEAIAVYDDCWPMRRRMPNSSACEVWLRYGGRSLRFFMPRPSEANGSTTSGGN